ncbi:hypothetical protein [Spiroplasma monobiae]|uniref:Lipoprotein n=1 Tax=Spiroplasma monobiae MQ-1 TaxID=1336748 RepID=A0A2K9LUM9_SPISQ|nr:hypothetical protein [Spiroplasma monobiae]AUM62763.1 hypothetical protein SMONO_v1c05140 [Spiroplasma monobiae MQ-1]
MKKILTLLSGLIITSTPLLTVISCRTGITGTRPESLDKVKFTSYPINLFGDPSDKDNFYDFLLWSNRNKGFEIRWPFGLSNDLTFKDPNNGKKVMPGTSKVWIDLLPYDGSEIYRFNIRTYYSDSEKKYDLVEEEQFQLKMGLDLRDESLDHIFKAKKIYLTDFIESGIEQITEKELFEKFEPHIISIFENEFNQAGKYEIDFTQNTINNLEFWDKSAKKYDNKKGEQVLNVQDLDFIYLKTININSDTLIADWNISEFPGEIEVGDVNIDDLQVNSVPFTTRNEVLKSFDDNRPEYQALKNFNNALLEQKQTNGNIIKWDLEGNNTFLYIANDGKSDEQFFGEKAEIEEYFSNANSEDIDLTILLIVSSNNTNPMIHGTVKIKYEQVRYNNL